MSTKVTQKVSELLIVLISLLSICTGIITYGIATRPRPFPIHIYAKRESGLESSSSRSVKIDLDKLLTELQVQQEESNEPEPVLEGAALYDSYVYDITATLYPDIEPDLIRAIIYTESRYDPTQVNSRSTAMGLTQIKPKWHTQRALNLGVEDLLDPYGNILVCCDILHELYQKYPKNYALDVYAGGYPYANDYSGTLSPHTIKINETIQGLRNGSIIPGGG